MFTLILILGTIGVFGVVFSSIGLNSMRVHHPEIYRHWQDLDVAISPFKQGELFLSFLANGKYKTLGLANRTLKYFHVAVVCEWIGVIAGILVMYQLYSALQ